MAWRQGQGWKGEYQGHADPKRIKSVELEQTKAQCEVERGH